MTRKHFYATLWLALSVLFGIGVGQALLYILLEGPVPLNWILFIIFAIGGASLVFELVTWTLGWGWPGLVNSSTSGSTTKEKGDSSHAHD